MVVKSHIETKEKRLPPYPVNAEIRERRLYNYLHVIGVYATNRFTISLSVSDWSDKVKYLIPELNPQLCWGEWQKLCCSI